MSPPEEPRHERDSESSFTFTDVVPALEPDAAGIDLRLRTFLRLGPRRFLLRHPDAAAERQPDAAAVIAIDVTNVASMVLTAAFLILIVNATASRTLPCDSPAVSESTPQCASRAEER